MSRERRLRLERLKDLRAKELDLRMTELMSARSAEATLQRKLDEAREKKIEAVDARDARARTGLVAGDWSQAENWLTSLSQREVLAQLQRDQATRAVVEARVRVSIAKAEQEKIELLIRRSLEETRQEETRAAHKLDDELAAQMAGGLRQSSARERR